MKMKVGYSTSIPIAAYGIKDNAWCEIEVEDGSDFNEAWSQLKDKVDAAVREKYPHLYQNPNPDYSSIPSHPMHQQEPETMDRRVAQIIEDINQCTEIDLKNSFGVQIGLISYEEVSKSNPEIQAAYDLKMAQLNKPK